jgi:hypothetical protein
MIQAQLQDRFPPVDRRVAVNSQAWVTGSPLALGIPKPPPPVGQRYFPDSFPPKDRRVAVSAQDWVTRWSALQLNAVPSAALPPGAQMFPTRFTPTDRRVAVSSQAWNFSIPFSTTNAQAFWSGSGSFSGVGEPSGLGVASWSGSGVFSGTGTAVVSAQASFTGAGAFDGAGVGPAPSVALWAGSGAFSGTSTVVVSATALWSGFGAFNAQQLTSTAAASFSGQGAFEARGAWANVLPFNYPPSWSIMIYGPTIEGVAFDPITRNMKVWFTGTLGQYIILENIPNGTTNAIDAAPDPEAYVLNLIASN